MYRYIIESKLEKILKKLAKRNRLAYDKILNKIDEIIQNPEHYKPLKNELKGIRRAHLGHFVLTFQIKDNTIIFLDFDHHDNIYEK
ncbi:MAG: type II toxin-antitoxin system RelE/ParE family toxin [archaeon]